MNRCIFFSVAMAAAICACRSAKTIQIAPMPVATQDAPSVPVNTSAPLTIDGLEFKKIDVQFSAKDVRVLKVAFDNVGNQYVALTADIDGKGQAPNGFMILKLDKVGKIIWRWPSAPDRSDNSKPHDEYRTGQLVGMDVTPEGVVWLMGMHSVNAPAMGDGNLRTIPWAAVNYTQSNNVFFERLGHSASPDAELRIQLERKVFSAPLWWTPLGIKANSDGTISIESHSGRNYSAHQIQTLSWDLKTHKASVCYIAPEVFTLQSDFKIMNTRAAQTSIDAMEAPYPTSPSDFASKNATDADIQARNENGRCWDMLNTKVMNGMETGYTVLKPKVGEPETRVRKVFAADSAAAGYEIKSDKTQETRGDPLELSLSERASRTTGLLVPLDNEIGVIATNQEDFVFGNMQTDQSKSWSVLLNSSVSRKPGSASAVLLEKDIILAWLEIHAEGEKQQGNRYLRFAKISKNTPSQKDVEFKDYEVPEAALGESTFSSVQIAKTHMGAVSVFATAGSKSGSDKAGDTAITSSLLLMAQFK